MCFTVNVPLDSNDEFDSTESDELLEDLMPPVEDMEEMDYNNQVHDECCMMGTLYYDLLSAV